MDWTYCNKLVTKVPDNAIGFVYRITLSTGHQYIGKKNCFKKLKLPALKNGTIREGAERIGKNKDGKRVYFDILTRETDWKEYTSSSDILDPELITHKTILEWAPTTRSLTYLETKYLFTNSVLEDENYLNRNILNKFFKGKLL